MLAAAEIQIVAVASRCELDRSTIPDEPPLTAIRKMIAFDSGNDLTDIYLRQVV